MQRQDIEPGQPVVLEGEEGNHFYCVLSGVLAVSNQGGLGPRRVLRPGEYFGEVALAMDVPRTASVTALTKVTVASCDREAFYLQERGHEVVGIDNSPLAVEVARRRGVEDARLLAFKDISAKLGVFDTVVMMCSNFGLFGSAIGARRMLRRLARITSPDARIVAGSRDPYATDNPDHLVYQESNRRQGRMSGQLRLRLRHGHYIGRWFDYLIVSPDEMDSLAKSGGWQVE